MVRGRQREAFKDTIVEILALVMGIVVAILALLRVIFKVVTSASQGFLVVLMFLFGILRGCGHLQRRPFGHWWPKPHGRRRHSARQPQNGHQASRVRPRRLHVEWWFFLHLRRELGAGDARPCGAQDRTGQPYR